MLWSAAVAAALGAIGVGVCKLPESCFPVLLLCLTPVAAEEDDAVGPDPACDVEADMLERRLFSSCCWSDADTELEAAACVVSGELEVC